MSRVPEGEAAVWLPAFTPRISNRARHVRLVVTAEGELVVVVPRRFDRRSIPSILEAKRAWIERAQARAADRRAERDTGGAEAGLPERLELPALGEAWQVEYRAAPAGARAVAREASGGRLLVRGPAGDEEACRRALIAWLRRRARVYLVCRLEELSRVHGLIFAQASVRHQRTRWGSCSPRGAISLNLRLLFLEPAVVDHVLLHELCHTRELNHSRRFWALFRAHDPDCAAHRRQARDAWRSLPGWLHAVRTGPQL